MSEYGTIPAAPSAESLTDYNYPADSTFRATGVAATDVAALNAAIAEVSASSTDPKVIRILNGLAGEPFAIGSAQTSDFDDIELQFDTMQLVDDSPAGVYMTGQRGIVRFKSLTRSAGDAHTSGIFHCGEVYGTVASNWTGTVFGNTTSSPDIDNKKIRILNLSTTAIYNFLQGDYDNADIRVWGTAVTTSTEIGVGAGGRCEFLCGGSSSGTTTVTRSNSMVHLVLSRNLTVSSNSNTIVCASDGSEGGSNFANVISGDGNILMGGLNGGSTTWTISGIQNTLKCNQADPDGAVTFALSGTKDMIEMPVGEMIISSNTATDGTYRIYEGTDLASQVWVLGTRAKWYIESQANGFKRTLSTAVDCPMIDLILPGDGSNDAVEISADCDRSKFKIQCTATGSSVTVKAGAEGNVIDIYSDTAPVIESGAELANTINWHYTAATIPTLRWQIGGGKWITTEEEVLALSSGTVTSAIAVESDEYIEYWSYKVTVLTAGSTPGAANKLNHAWNAGRLTAGGDYVGSGPPAKNEGPGVNSTDINTSPSAQGKHVFTLQTSGGSTVTDGTGSVRVRHRKFKYLDVVNEP